MRMPRTLTARLVVTAVALVALVGTLVAVAGVLGMRGYLLDRLDGQVQSALQRAFGQDPDGSPGDRGLFQGPGTMVVIVSNTPAISTQGWVVPEQRGAVIPLGARDIRAVGRLRADQRVHSVSAGGRDYRAEAATDSFGNKVVVGLPRGEVDRTLSNMAAWFALLTLLGVLVAAGVGTLLVRRQLAPLVAVADTAREVSAQELSRGDTEIGTRVPARLVDEVSEVGQVGLALNTLLDHVQEALSARHRSEQQVRQFVADASHELRTPLSTIHGYAELSRRTPDDASALQHALGKVETEADRMSGLVEDLLLLARLDAGRPLARQEVDVTRLLLEAVADARVVAPGHTWRLELPEEPVTLTGDADRLHQVVTNLLNNARSHTPPGTTVRVRAERLGDEVRVSVCDDGPGLPPDLVARAFERFARGDSSRTRASGGAGLGLSLVEAIAEAHGGRAEVHSAPGSTTFEVSLPA